VPLGHEARSLANALAAFGYEDDVPAVKDPRFLEWFKANTQPAWRPKGFREPMSRYRSQSYA